MAESITEFLVENLNGIFSSEFIAFFVSLLPVLELRGGLIAAKLLEIDLLKAFAICYTGNILPIPFILVFIDKIFAYLKKTKLNNMVEK